MLVPQSHQDQQDGSVSPSAGSMARGSRQGQDETLPELVSPAMEVKVSALPSCGTPSMRVSIWSWVLVPVWDHGSFCSPWAGISAQS